MARSSKEKRPLKVESSLGSIINNFDNELMKPGYGHTDIYEHEGYLYFDIEIPGVKKEDLDVTIEDSTLFVKCKSKEENQVNTENYLRMERKYGQFQRGFPLPDVVDFDRTSELSAKYNDGMLTVSLPLKDSLRGETINITIE